jgi:hypothetical protein
MKKWFEEECGRGLYAKNTVKLASVGYVWSICKKLSHRYWLTLYYSC